MWPIVAVIVFDFKTRTLCCSWALMHKSPTVLCRYVCLGADDNLPHSDVRICVRGSTEMALHQEVVHPPRIRFLLCVESGVLYINSSLTHNNF